MVAIVTDSHFRMSIALVRDLGEAGVTVICCESDQYRNRKSTPPLGSLSRHCAQHYWLSADNYREELLSLCRKIGEHYHCSPALLPVGAGTLSLIAAERKCFDAVCGLVIPTAQQLALFNSKEYVSSLAASLSIPVPRSFFREKNESVTDFAARLPYPCVIKPVCGEKLGLSAAQRYLFANNAQEAVHAFSHFLEKSGEEPVVQQKLTGNGLGCSVLAQNGKILHAICHRRLREYPVSGGPSSCCRCEMQDELLEYTQRLVAHTGYSGLAMFEFKEDGDGKAHLLEVNPRIWGTYPLTRVSRSGLSLLWCTISWNAVNPNDCQVIPPVRNPGSCKMIFAASDLMAAIGYFRRGKPAKLFAAMLDLVNPCVRDGVFEWNDRKPAIAYLRSLLAKERHR